MRTEVQMPDGKRVVFTTNGIRCDDPELLADILRLDRYCTVTGFDVDRDYHRATITCEAFKGAKIVAYEGVLPTVPVNGKEPE